MEQFKFAFPAFANHNHSPEPLLFHIYVFKDEHGLFYQAWFEEMEDKSTWDFKCENGNWYRRCSNFNTWDHTIQDPQTTYIGNIIDANIQFFGYKKYIAA